jgi:hypothetical protein
MISLLVGIFSAYPNGPVQGAASQYSEKIEQYLFNVDNLNYA